MSVFKPPSGIISPLDFFFHFPCSFTCLTRQPSGHSPLVSLTWTTWTGPCLGLDFRQICIHGVSGLVLIVFDQWRPCHGVPHRGGVLAWTVHTGHLPWHKAFGLTGNPAAHRQLIYQGLLYSSKTVGKNKGPPPGGLKMCRFSAAVSRRCPIHLWCHPTHSQGSSSHTLFGARASLDLP